jgi:hypothetical protein
MCQKRTQCASNQRNERQMLTSKTRGPNRFRKREARRLFEAGAERVEFDPKTGRLIGYRQAETATPPANEWDKATEKLQASK